MAGSVDLGNAANMVAALPPAAALAPVRRHLLLVIVGSGQVLIVCLLWNWGGFALTMKLLSN